MASPWMNVTSCDASVSAIGKTTLLTVRLSKSDTLQFSPSLI